MVYYIDTTEVKYMNNLIKINILQLPLITKFYLDERILFLGLLTEAVYDDGSHRTIEDPYLIYPQPETPGLYECKIYLDKEHLDIYGSFSFEVFQSLQDLQSAVPSVLAICTTVAQRSTGTCPTVCPGDVGISKDCISEGDKGCGCYSSSTCSSSSSKDSCNCTSSSGRGCGCSSSQACNNDNSRETCYCSASSSRGCGCNDLSNCDNSSSKYDCSCTSNSDSGCGCSSLQQCTNSSSEQSCYCTSSSDRGCGCSNSQPCSCTASGLSDCTTDSQRNSCDCTSSSDEGCGCSSTQPCTNSSSKGTCSCTSSSNRGCGCSSTQACSCTATGLSACVTCPSSGSATTKEINIEVQKNSLGKSQIENITTAIIDGSSKTVGIGYWRSNNYNKTSTTAEMTSNSVSLNSGDKIGIDYYVLSESNFDKLNIYIYKDGSQVDSVTASGYNSGWSNKTYIISSSGNYSVKIQYVKDGSGNNGADRAWIRRPYYHIDGVNYLFEFTNTGSYGFDELRYQKI